MAAPKMLVREGKRSATALVTQWAAEHDGEVVLNDFALAAADGMYPSYRQAYNAGYTVVRRDPKATKVAPGRYMIRDGEPCQSLDDVEF